MIRGVIFPSFLPYSFELNHTFKGYGLYRSITHWGYGHILGCVHFRRGEYIGIQITHLA